MDIICCINTFLIYVDTYVTIFNMYIHKNLFFNNCIYALLQFIINNTRSIVHSVHGIVGANIINKTLAVHTNI